jgi:hypothetical protein
MIQKIVKKHRLQERRHAATGGEHDEERERVEPHGARLSSVPYMPLLTACSRTHGSRLYFGEGLTPGLSCCRKQK